ncbi:MAG: hypothetical protein MJK04_26470, partial [Psychrosphaera sp.]|nr:hypothetical protein [Psychrosphaera sp.]
MACFNSESMKDLERTLRTSIQNVLEDAAAYSTFETSVKAFDSKASPPQVILPASVGAAIAAKWINQLISNDDGSKLLRLLCYYQLPYKKAVYFNLLTTGILSFCHQALVTMQKDALKTLLSETIKLHHLAIALAKVLQQSLRLDDMKKTIICVRPKYIKASAKISSPDAAQQLAQLINKIYIPLLAPTLRLVGLAATGTAEETRRFDFSVEAGMTQAQATHLIASIDQARDMLELNDQWYNFFKKERKDKALQWFNKDTDVQKKIKTIYLDMFKQQILKSEINTKTFKKVISTSDAPTERSETFFDDKFNITPMAIFYQHFVSGDPVQLRLFSDEDSGDESRFEGSSSTSGSFGVSLFRDCHLTPLG